MLYLKRDLKGVKMQRNPWDQFIKDPENKAKLFLFINGVMILTTFLIVIGTIIFILILVGSIFLSIRSYSDKVIPNFIDFC